MPKIRFWGITEEYPEDISHTKVIHCFTRGQCTSLARAIHKLTGWPLYVLAKRECSNRRELNSYGAHVVCKRPDGKYVDITGAWSREERWLMWQYVIPTTDSEVKKIGWDRQNVRNAMFYARKVIKACGLGD